MTSANERRELLDWNLLYLFSFDVELILEKQQKVGIFPDGVRLTLFARPELCRVYNVGRESTVAGDGRPAIAGEIVTGGDQAVLRDDDVGTCDIRLTIHTDDQADINMRYQIFGYLGPGGTDRIVRGRGRDRLGTEDEPSEIPIVTSPRFETASHKYLWMNKLQAIGFGRTHVIRNKFRRNTQDIYALT